MSGKASSSGAGITGRHKRKRVAFAEAPSSMKSPCTKAARGGHFNVFLVGYTEKEKFDIVRSCPDEIDVKDIMSTSITHIVVKPPTKKDKAFPYAVMYYAVVSGAWLLRPSWLMRSTECVVPEAEHEYKHNQVDLQKPTLARFRDILKLYGSYQKMREEEECRFFCDPVFRRVYILANRTNEGRLKKATLKSIIEAGGGSLAEEDSWQTIRKRPLKANDLVSVVIIENGDDLNVHNINISFVKQLLIKGIPVLYEEILSQLLNNQVVPNLEVMMTHAVYYWGNEHREKLTLSSAELASVQKLQHASGDVSMQKETTSPTKSSYSVRNDLVMSASPSPASSVAEEPIVEARDEATGKGADAHESLALEEFGTLEDTGTRNAETEDENAAAVEMEVVPSSVDTHGELEPLPRTLELSEEVGIEPSVEQVVDEPSMEQSSEVHPQELVNEDILSTEQQQTVEEPQMAGDNPEMSSAEIAQGSEAVLHFAGENLETPQVIEEVPEAGEAMEEIAEAVGSTPIDTTELTAEDATTVEVTFEGSAAEDSREAVLEKPSDMRTSVEMSVDVEEHQHIESRPQEEVANKGAVAVAEEMEVPAAESVQPDEVANAEKEMSVLVRPPKPHFAKDTKRALGLMRRLEVDLKDVVEPIPDAEGTKNSSVDVSEKPNVCHGGVEEKRHYSQPVDDILDDTENEIRENQLKTRRNVVCSPIAEDDEQQHSLVVDDAANELKVVHDDCGLFEIYHFDSEQKPNTAVSDKKHSWCDSVSILSHLVPKALAKSGVESGSFSDRLWQFFDAIMVEMKNNVPSSFTHDFISHEVVTSLRNSLHPSLLPTPNILSRLLHDIAKPEFGQKFDAANAAYRLLMFFLYQFPACNEEGRFYWLQVLTDAPSNDDSSSGPRRVSLLEWNDLLSRTAGLRKMILDTFTCGGSNHTLMEFAVSVLEVDLFNMEGCDGLNTSQEILDEDDNCNRTTHFMNDDTFEHLQNSSVLNGVPLSYLVFYDPHERRKQGLDGTAMETCCAIVDNAVSAKSVLCAYLCWRLLAVCLEGLRFFLANTMKLFRGEEISVDLQSDVERLGRYLIKKGLNKDEIDRCLPMSWISDIIHAVP